MNLKQLAVCLVFATNAACVHAVSDDAAALPEHVPAGYALVYSEDFESDDAIEAYRFTDADAWRLSRSEDGNTYLELFGESAYQPKHRSPRNIGLLSTGAVGSFVLDVDLKQVGREYNHRDLCIFFGFNDPEHYYYTHMATRGDQNAHHVFIVNDAPRTPITTERTEGVDWGTDDWRHVRVVRDAEAGTIAVYFDDMENPVQIAKDTTFARGYIGFGSFDDTGRVDNIRLYAPQMSDESTEDFEQPATSEE